MPKPKARQEKAARRKVKNLTKARQILKSLRMKTKIRLRNKNRSQKKLTPTSRSRATRIKKKMYLWMAKNNMTVLQEI